MSSKRTRHRRGPLTDSEKAARRASREANKRATIDVALNAFDRLSNDALVRQPVVEALFACSAATVWRRVGDGRIPKPRKVSDRLTAWRVGDLREVLKSL